MSCFHLIPSPRIGVAMMMAGTHRFVSFVSFSRPPRCPQTLYVDLRNSILNLWQSDVSSHVTVEQAVALFHKRYAAATHRIFGFLEQVGGLSGLPCVLVSFGQVRSLSCVPVARGFDLAHPGFGIPPPSWCASCLSAATRGWPVCLASGTGGLWFGPMNGECCHEKEIVPVRRR